MTREHAPNRRRGNSADALSWWGHVTVAAGSVTLSIAKAWEKKARATAAQSVQFLQLYCIRPRAHVFHFACTGSQGGQRRPIAVTKKEALGKAKDPSQVLIK